MGRAPSSGSRVRVAGGNLIHHMTGNAGAEGGNLNLLDRALIGYKTTDIYSPAAEFNVRWTDCTIGIGWPQDGEPIFSDKDREALLFTDISEPRLTGF